MEQVVAAAGGRRANNAGPTVHQQKLSNGYDNKVGRARRPVCPGNKKERISASPSAKFLANPNLLIETEPPAVRRTRQRKPPSLQALRSLMQKTETTVADGAISAGVDQPGGWGLRDGTEGDRTGLGRRNCEQRAGLSSPPRVPSDPAGRKREAMPATGRPTQ